MLLEDSTTLEKYPSDFKIFLKQVLVERNKRNPRYSLRSFSATLGLSSSFLSKLLSGKRPFTEKTFLKVSRSLSLKPELHNYYLNSEIRSQKNQLSSKDSHEFETITTIRSKYKAQFKPLEQDHFEVISEWYHYAILELLTLEGFILNPNYIASQLKITVLEAQHAIERLLRLGLINEKVSKVGKKKYTSENHTTVDSVMVGPATSRQQAGLLRKASEALVEIPAPLRSQSSMTLAIPRSRMNEAQKMIKDFRREFSSKMQRTGKRDSVYQLTISFFPLTKWEY